MRLLSHLPLPLIHVLGSALGAAYGLVPNRHRRIARINLESCFPELTPRERKWLLRRSLLETGKTLLEVGPLWLRAPARVLGLVREVSGEDLVRAALAAGKGVIILTPHLGAWELFPCYAPTLGPMTFLYRPPRRRELGPMLRQTRGRAGVRLAPTSPAGVRMLYRALARGELVGILPDQEPQRGTGVFAPFFGIPAYTMVLVPRLVQRTGARVLFCVAERLRLGVGYRVSFYPPPRGIDSADLAEAAAAMNSGVEACVRRLPEQYQWAYKRFRTRPVKDTGFYG